MIRVTGPLLLWTGETGSWHFLAIPAEQSDEIRAHCLVEMRGFRSARVEVTIGAASTDSAEAVTWRTSVFPMQSGGYFLPVKAEVRRNAGIAAGDQVTAAVELL